MTTEQQATSEVVLGVTLSMVDVPRLRAYAKELKLKVGGKDDAEKLVSAVTEKMIAESKKNPDGFVQCDPGCGAISASELPACPFCGKGGDEEAKAEEPEHEAKPKTNGLAVVPKSSPSSTSLVHASPKQDLKRILGQVRGFVKDWQNCAWDIGERLILLAAEGPDRPALWKLEKGEDKVQQKYKSFSAFVKAEVGISEEMAKTCVYAAKEFKREQLTGFTVSKLSIVLNAPESEQRKLLGKAGAKTAKELVGEVRELNIKHGEKLKAKGQKDPTEKRRKARQERAKKENAAKDASKGITTFVLDGKSATAKLYKKDKDNDGELIQASSVTDAWGWIEGKNGVQLVFRLEKNDDGRLKIRFEAKRETSEE